MPSPDGWHLPAGVVSAARNGHPLGEAGIIPAPDGEDARSSPCYKEKSP